MKWAEYIENANEIIEEQDLTLDERLVKKEMIRDRKRIKKWVSTKPGWKVEYDKNHMPREVKISATEKKNRKLAQQKAKRKRKAKEKFSQKLRLSSFKKRDSLGLDYDKKNPALVTAREEGKKIPSDIKGALKQKLDNMKNSLSNRLRSLSPD